MAAPDSAGAAKVEEEEEIGPPPQPKVSPYYSVARQRARQQIRNARSCLDMGLRAERLAAALELGESVGLPEPALQIVQEELQSAEGAARAVVEHPAQSAQPRPQSRYAPQPPLRPVTPVVLEGLAGGVPVAPGSVALLLMRDDGTAELRDAYSPCQQTALECPAFDVNCVSLASSFAVAMDPGHAAGAPRVFDHGAVQDLIDDCGAFKAVVAVVDPLRPGGQVLCSQFLSHGPRGALCGVIVAAPSTETPAPFSGPAYAALSVLLCLGGETLGLGGSGWKGGGVFGRRLAIVDRAAAYVGGWPSMDVGRLAFKVVEAAVATRAPGGTAGSFLFGPEPGSPEELQRAAAVRAWLQGATQASHTSQAWIEHFTRAGVMETEHNDGPMWLHTAEKAGRWPAEAAKAGATDGEGEEGDEEGAEEAPADEPAAGGEEGAEGGEGGAEGAEGEAATQAQESADAQEAPDYGPPKDLPAPPPLVGVAPAKLAVPFGFAASQLLAGASGEGADEGFRALASEALPDQVEGGLPRGAEVLVVLDLACPELLGWSTSTWESWASAVKAVGGVLVAAPLLPASDASALDWNTALPCLHALIEHFDLVVWLQHKAAPAASQCGVLTALLDPAVPLALLATHLVPYRRLHFCTAYCGGSAQALAADLAAGSCADAGGGEEPGAGAGQALAEALAKAGREPAEAGQAAWAVRALLSELAGHCGVSSKQQEEGRAGAGGDAAASPQPDGEEGQEADGEGGGEDAEAPDADATADAEADAEGGGDEEEGGQEAGDGEGAAAGGDASGPASALPTQRGPAVQNARMLSFVVGGIGAAATLEGALSLEGEQLQASRDQPSMAYPISAYGYGCVPLRPWGTSWARPREDVVVFAVHTRVVAAVMKRIVGGVGEGDAEVQGN